MCAMFSTLSHVLHMSASDTAISQHADPLDLELDDVAPLQPAPVAVLEDAAGADRAGAEDVAGAEVRVPGRLREDRVPGVVHVRELAARTFLAVDAGDHRPGCPVELVGRDDDRPEARREVLALGRPESDAHLRPLEVAYGRWVEDGRPKVDVGERILGMAARVPAAGEERLQRLRRELVDDAVLDQPRP